MNIKEFNQKYGVSLKIGSLDERTRITMVRLGARLKKEKIYIGVKNLTAEKEEKIAEGERLDIIRGIVEGANQDLKKYLLTELATAIKEHVISAVVKDSSDGILVCDSILTFVREFIQTAVEELPRWEFSGVVFPDPNGAITVREITRTVKDALCEVESYARVYALLCKEGRLGFTASDVEMLLYKYTDPSLSDLKKLAKHKEGLSLLVADRNEMKSLSSLIRTRHEIKILNKVEAFIARHADGSKSSVYALARASFSFIGEFYSEIEEYEELEYKRGGKIFQIEQ